jgi:very-short-patch-repair endonuclease
MNIFICDVCSKEFASKQALGGHKSASHRESPRYSVKRTVIQKSKEYFCQFCNRKTTNAGANKKHENTCKSNPNPVEYQYHNKGGHPKGHIPWNKGLTKDTSDIIRKSAEQFSIKYSGENNFFYGKKHSAETKKKISDSRKKFIEENPHMSPWVYSHYTKRRSYAERYWKKILDKHKISFEEQHQFSKYCLDFAILDCKINLEIDGEQHYNETRVIEKDKSRDEYMIDRGWKIIRIRWKEYKKLNKEERKEFVSNLINKIKVL